jgi:hypothetical protein
MAGEQHERQPDAAGARLASLRASAADAYDAIVAADDALAVLAGRRVAAERVLRHALARPGPAVLPCCRPRARREWRERRAILATALADAEQLLADTRQALADVKQEFTARLRSRAEAVAELRRLTGECAAARDELDAAEEEAG